MTARTTRRTRLLAAVATTAGALALTVLPTTAAQAVTPPAPLFSYVDNGTLTPSSGSADAGTTAPLVTSTTGTYRAYDVDATPDGAFSVMSLCNGTIAACTDNPAGSRFDATYGVLLLHNEGTTISSRLLTNLTSTNAAISADGSTVVWMYGNTLHVFDTGAISNVETYTTSALAAPKVATEVPTRVAVSGDGSQVAVMYRDATGATAGRVLAFPTKAATLTGATYFQKSYPKSVTAPAKPLRPSSASFTFVGNTTVVYNEFDGTNPQTSSTTRDAVQGTLSLNNLTPGPSALAASLQDFYRLRQDASGSWWAWKDVDGAGNASTADATVSNIDNPLAVSPVIQTGPTRTDSATTYGYTPSTVAPPTLDTAVTTTGNLAAAHPTFAFSAATVAYNGRSAYQTYNLYGGLPDGKYLTAATAAETDRGVLESSFNGTTFTPVLTTSGARAFVLGTQYYNGYATLLRRTVYYRWTWKGDAFTTAFTSPVRKITVIPNVYAKVTKSGASKIVSGSITRPTGNVSLYKLVSKTRYARIASARIVRVSAFGGSYSFGKRKLAAGTYKVVSAADAYAGSGAKAFKI